MHDAFDGCSDNCGWAAALLAMLAYGTYGVPIKETRHLDIAVHPLVFQSYKTAVMLLSCPAVLCLGVSFSFTPWGVVSGAFWVLGGTGGVAAVRWAGMATAVGTWASVMIGVNFVWGILVFQEPVAHVGNTTAAFVLLGCGLIGMSRYGAPSAGGTERGVNELSSLSLSSENVTDDGDMEHLLALQSSNSNNSNGSSQSTLLRRGRSEISTSNEMEEIDNMMEGEAPLFNPETHVTILGKVLRKRNAGIMAAVFNGLMGGSSLIPLHYAKKHGYGGPHYMMSYAIGASAANSVIWMVYYAMVLLQTWRQNKRNRNEDASSSSEALSRLCRQAYDRMPEVHLKLLWKTGLCAGLLLTTAMFGSILSVTYLGQGIGNSVIQSKIIVSGMWGIFYYKEISNPRMIRRWFLSACMSVAGIVWLSQERISGRRDDDDDSSHRMLLEIF